MSVPATKWALRPHRITPAERVVLLYQADKADKNGRGAYMSAAEIAAQSGLHETTVRAAFKTLRDLRLIKAVGRHGPTRAVIYDLLLTDEPVKGQAVLFSEGSSIASGEGPTLASRDPRLSRPSPLAMGPIASGDPSTYLRESEVSLEHQDLSSSSEDEKSKVNNSPSQCETLRSRAHARRLVTYRGRKVAQDISDRAERLLAVFTESAGRSVPAWTAAGDPTPALKQVVGALLVRDEVSEPEWVAAIRAFAANPPAWVDGPLQIGHVFGERAAEHALTAGRGHHNGNGNGVIRSGDFARAAQALTAGGVL